MALSWKVYFDWTTAGTFDTSRNDAVNMTDYRVTRGRHQFIKENGEGLERVPPGCCQIKLDNRNGEYDPYNTSSVLYPKVEPGRYMTIKVEEGTYSWYRFTGCVESIETVGGASNPEVLITAYDGLKYLQNTRISTQVYSFGYMGGAGSPDFSRGGAIAYVSTSAEWPSIYGATAINDSTLVIYTPNFWVNEKSAYEAIADIADTEVGLYGCKASGALFYRAREDTTAALTITQADVLKDVDLPMPYNLKRNAAKVYIYAKSTPESSAVKLWKYNEVPLVDTAAGLTIWGRYRYDGRDVAGYGMIAPADTTDFKMNTKPDGTGTDRTAQWDVTTTYFGEVSKNVITADGANVDHYCTLLKNRGYPIDDNESTYVTYDYSGTSSSPRYLIINNPYIQLKNAASVFDSYIQLQAAHTLKYPRFQIEGRPTIQFAFDLFDPIDIDIAKYGINQTYLVGAIEEEWVSPNGQAVLTTVYTEPEDNLA